MAESARRAGCAACPEAEALEGRMLLSRSAGAVPAVDVQYELAQHYATPQSGEVDLTVTRSPARASGAAVFKVETSATLDVPRQPGANKRPPYGSRTLGPVSSISNGPGGVVSWIIHTTGRDRSALPIVPIDGTYRFAPGQTSVTIPLRLNPNFVLTGEISMDVVAYSPKRHYGKWWGGPAGMLTIVPGPDQIPPEIVSSSFSPRAITLTFSKPMDPATVEDINNYQVTGYSPTTPTMAPSPAPAMPRRPGVLPDGPVPVATMAPSPTLVALKSAVYDPATRTVTLTPTDPLTLANYSLFPRSRNINPIGLPTSGVKPLADLQGNMLVGSGIGFGT